MQSKKPISPRLLILIAVGLVAIVVAVAAINGSLNLLGSAAQQVATPQPIQYFTPTPTSTPGPVAICHFGIGYTYMVISYDQLSVHQAHSGDIIPAPAGGCPVPQQVMTPTNTSTPSQTPTFTPPPPTSTPTSTVAVITVSISCNRGLGTSKITFTLKNVGASMTSPGNYELTFMGIPAKSGTFMLDSGQSTTISNSTVSGSYKLTLTNIPNSGSWSKSC